MKKLLINYEKYWKSYYLESEYDSNIGENQFDVIKEPMVSSFLLKKGYNPEYPDGKTFAICLTHDVDEIYTPLIHRAHSLTSTFTSAQLDNLSDAFCGIWDKRKSKYSDFGKIMSLEEKYDSRSTFFFLGAKKDPLRFRYDIEDICNNLGEINDRGFDLGLHGGFFSYDDYEALSSEKRRLEKASGFQIEGYRSHYLNLHIPRTWKHLSKLGFKYDTTLGYRRGLGFRNGMCHPFYPYIRENDEELNLLEIPLIIMDAAFPTIGFTVRKYWEEILRIIDIVEKNRGILTINWHNDSLLTTRKSEQGKLYEKILAEGKKRGAWLSNCHEVTQWWNMNHKKFEKEIYP